MPHIQEILSKKPSDQAWVIHSLTQIQQHVRCCLPALECQHLMVSAVEFAAGAQQVGPV